MARLASAAHLLTTLLWIIWMAQGCRAVPVPEAEPEGIPADSIPTSTFDLKSTPAPTQRALASPSRVQTSSPTAIPTDPPPTSTRIPCPIFESGGLITELQDITARMPEPGSEGMRVPDEQQIAAWQLLVEQTASGDLQAACSTIALYEFPYQVVQFTDLPAQNEEVVLLRERSPIDFGWGTYVFRLGGSRDLVIEVPHPIADEITRNEGITMFRELKARALLVAGTHRCANSNFAECGGTTIACGQVEPYRVSDVAHADRTMFQAAHQRLVPCGGTTVAIQLHGNSLHTCPDLFISNGSINPGPLSRAFARSAKASCSGFSVDLADGEEGECGFYGNGVQAMYSLGCASSPEFDACTDYTLRPYGPEQYLSLEQSPEMRADYGCITEALLKTFP